MGFAVASAWGAGAAIIGRDEDAGLGADVGRGRGPRARDLTSPTRTRRPPRGCVAGAFARYNTAERMRLGPDPGYVPGRVFGMFNLFWG